MIFVIHIMIFSKTDENSFQRVIFELLGSSVFDLQAGAGIITEN